MPVDELLATLFDGQPHPLDSSMAMWLASSRRFTAFVSANHTKIRKKLRSADEPDNVRDLRLELETAWLLLRERSLSVAYEPQHPREGRSPDFAVTFTTSLTFMVEVTRLRPAASALPLGERFHNLLCSKLGSFCPSAAMCWWSGWRQCIWLKMRCTPPCCACSEARRPTTWA